MKREESVSDCDYVRGKEESVEHQPKVVGPSVSDSNAAAQEPRVFLESVHTVTDFCAVLHVLVLADKAVKASTIYRG